MATELGDVTSYKRLYMQFRDSAAKTTNITLNNPKNLEDGDYVDLAAQDAAIEGTMDTIITKNIFHNNGNDLVAKVNARILDYKSTDVMDVQQKGSSLFAVSWLASQLVSWLKTKKKKQKELNIFCG